MGRNVKSSVASTITTYSLGAIGIKFNHSNKTQRVTWQFTYKGKRFKYSGKRHVYRKGRKATDISMYRTFKQLRDAENKVRRIR